jgi:hypothetical protein
MQGEPPETAADWRRVAHVDAPDLDLVLPHNAAGLDPEAHDIAASVRRMGSRHLLEYDVTPRQSAHSVIRFSSIIYIMRNTDMRLATVPAARPASC